MSKTEWESDFYWATPGTGDIDFCYKGLKKSPIPKYMASGKIGILSIILLVFL